MIQVMFIAASFAYLGLVAALLLAKYLFCEWLTDALEHPDVLRALEEAVQRAHEQDAKEIAARKAGKASE